MNKMNNGFYIIPAEDKKTASSKALNHWLANGLTITVYIAQTCVSIKPVPMIPADFQWQLMPFINLGRFIKTYTKPLVRAFYLIDPFSCVGIR